MIGARFLQRRVAGQQRTHWRPFWLRARRQHAAAKVISGAISRDCDFITLRRQPPFLFLDFAHYHIIYYMLPLIFALPAHGA